MLFSSTYVGNPKNPQVHSHMETIQKKVPQISPIIISLLCALFSTRCNCRSIIPSGIAFTARISSVQVMLAAASSQFSTSRVSSPSDFLCFLICLYFSTYAFTRLATFIGLISPLLLWQIYKGLEKAFRQLTVLQQFRQATDK